jgi:hypothetical protein
MSGRPASGHVQPNGNKEKPGPDVPVSEREEAVVDEVSDVDVSVKDVVVLVYIPRQMYRPRSSAIVDSPVDAEWTTLSSLTTQTQLNDKAMSIAEPHLPLSSGITPPVTFSHSAASRSSSPTMWQVK